jgi:hypothetical protein
MDSRLQGNKGFMAINLDMSKAYDKVVWLFLEEIMRKLVFTEQWIELLIICVKSPTYSILINGNPLGL